MSVAAPGLALPLAHTGHWISGVLYVVPVVAIVAWLWISQLRAKRRGK